MANAAGDELLDVVVIGGSQAGLAMAWHLARQHLRFVVLEGFEARTDDGVFRARRVVVATGPFQVPDVPSAAQRLDGSVTQLHSAVDRIASAPLPFREGRSGGPGLGRQQRMAR
jgi:cation diffusion facilitator CzcD-associated flavoprotein CzcO